MRFAAYLVAAGVILFFALTRTEVGREGLRLELERQFGERFGGDLEIGRLSGNLTNRISAGNVQVRDSSGRVLFAADSIIARPAWQDLLRRTVTTGRITLIRPELHLTREADGTWNASTIVRGDRAASDDRPPWSFHSTEIRVIDGRVVTHSEGAPPQVVVDGSIFNFVDAEAVNLDGRAIVDWGPDLKLIDVLSLSGRVPDIDLPLDSLRGQFVIQDGGLGLNEVHLRIGETRLHLAGSVSSYADLRDRPSEAIVEVDLRSSTLRADELSRIFPSLPFTDQLQASLRAQGPLSGLVIEDLQVSRGTSWLSAEGTLIGLPDSLDYEMAFRPSAIAWNDVEAVAPGSPLPDFEHLGAIQFAGFSDGILRFGERTSLPFWQAKSEIQTSSRAGRVHADMNVALGGRPYFSVDGTVLTHDFDVGVLARDEAITSDINGRATITASGPDLMNANGGLTISLSDSRFAGRSLDTLRFDLAGEEGLLTGRIRAAQGPGMILARVRADLDSLQSTYSVDGAFSRVDVGRMLLSDSLHSSLNLHFGMDGRGNSPETFAGRLNVAFDSSTVEHGTVTRVVPPHRTAVTVRQRNSERPFIEIAGDVLTMQVRGDVAADAFVALTRHWDDATRSAMNNALGSSLRSDTLVARAPVLSDESGDVELESQTIAARVQIKRSDILSALLPMLPEVRTDLDAEVDLYLDWDQFSIRMAVKADSFDTDALEARAVDVTFDASGSYQDVLSNRWNAGLDAAALHVVGGGQAFASPTLEARMRDRGMDVDIVTTASGAVAPLRFTGRLHLLPDRARLRVKALQLAARDQIWQADSTYSIDVFRDGIVVPSFTIRRTDPEAAGSERVRIVGILSPSTSDSLMFDVRDVRLQDVMELMAVSRPVGGAVNGEIVYKGFQRQPELTGTVRVDPLSYDDRVLGTLLVESRYIPGSPDVGLEVRILPLEKPDADSRTYESNDLQLAGTFRLPGIEADGLRDDGALDLDLDIRQLDAFLLEYVLKQEIAGVEGSFKGTGSIEGSFAYPLFYAALDLDSGSFRVPDFNLEYSASGSVRVDELGIHLENVDLRDRRSGRAVVKGSILFNEYRYFSFDLHGRLNDLRIMNVNQSRELPFYGRILASGDVSLTGPVSSAMLRSTNAVTNADSDLYIPITESGEVMDAGFIVFADSTGKIPDLRQLTTRANLLAERPAGERPFLDGLEMDLNITAPVGSTVHLVIDPLLGDVINAVGSGRIQLVRSEGEFFTYGTFDVDSGDYLFTAGEVFFRRFLIDDGSITWDGDPLNATLDITASYRTRASTEGLADACASTLIPLVVRMNVLGRVSTPSVDLALAVDRDDRSQLNSCLQGLEAELNEAELTAQYATSVLLTNSFLLTTTSLGSEQSQGLSDTRNQLAFNSLSQLVASQLNRYLNYALPNLDVNLGLQGESAQDLDLTYGVALRFLDERLIIRGQGIVQNESTETRQQSGLDEFVVEVRLNSRVSVEVFYRREGDLLSSSESFSTNTTGAGVSYQTQFSTWRRFIDSLFGWLFSREEEEEPADTSVVAGT